MKILVIEDSGFLRLAIGRVLQRCGYEVIGAPDGQAGLRAVRTEFPQLILLDMMLPELDGTGVLKQLKEDPSTAQIPVIVLTSLSQRNEEKLKEAGATAYLEKLALNLDRNAEPLIQVVKEAARAQSFAEAKKVRRPSASRIESPLKQ